MRCGMSWRTGSWGRAEAGSRGALRGLESDLRTVLVGERICLVLAFALSSGMTSGAGLTRRRS